MAESLVTIGAPDLLGHEPYGPELMTDGDMEAADASAYAAGASATLSKETTNPHSGVRLLKVLFGGSASPFAQQTILTVGKRYHAKGWARGDTVVTPRLLDGFAAVFTGTSSGSWQIIDVIFIASSTALKLQSLADSAGEYCDFDDMSIREIL